MQDKVQKESRPNNDSTFLRQPKRDKIHSKPFICMNDAFEGKIIVICSECILPRWSARLHGRGPNNTARIVQMEQQITFHFLNILLNQQFTTFFLHIKDHCISYLEPQKCAMPNKFMVAISKIAVVQQMREHWYLCAYLCIERACLVSCTVRRKVFPIRKKYQ